MKFLEYENAVELLDIIHEDFQENETKNKNKLIKKLPKQYKTKTKLEYINKLGEDITEEEFVGLLLIQTHDYDYINYEYFIKYYDLKLDNNNMIIFNDRFTYTMCKMERLYIWWIIKNLELHPMFSKYMDGQLQYTLQRKLEDKIFAMKDNFKYDLCFIERNIGIEINENHHSKKLEKYKDWQKVSLAKFHGIAMINLITDKCDNITNFVKDLYKNKKQKTSICKDIINYLGLPETIDLYNHVSDLLQSGLLTKMGRSANKTLKNDIKRFNGNKRYKIVTKKYINIEIDKYVQLYIYNSPYLKEFLENLYDYLLCSLLSDYDFRQNYISKVFLEKMISLQYTQITNIYNETDPEYIDYVKIDFSNINKICKKLNLKTDNECVKLFDYKKRSLVDPKNPDVIKLLEVLDICDLNINNMNIINKFIFMVEKCCNFKRNSININSLISWKDINKIIIKCELNQTLRDTLLLYYNEIETIYENIAERTKTHSLRITSTSDDYDNYMNRVKKKTIVFEKRALNKFVNKYIKDFGTIVKDNVLDNLKDSSRILDKEFKRKVSIIDTNSNIVTNYNCDDLYMIGLTDNETRIDNLYNEFYATLSAKDGTSSPPKLIMNSDLESNTTDSELDV